MRSMGKLGLGGPLYGFLLIGLFGCDAPPAVWPDTPTTDAGVQVDAFLSTDSGSLPSPEDAGTPLRPGEMDLAFGDRGIVETSSGGALAVAGNRDLLAGSVGRFTPEGARVPTFGDDGEKHLFEISAIVPDGEKYVLLGNSSTACYVFRILDDGAFDPSLHGGAAVWFPDCAFDAVVVDDDASVTVFGRRDRNSGIGEPAFETLIVRLTPTGALDPAFGGDGMIVGDELGVAYATFLATNAARRTEDSIVALAGSRLLAFNTDGTLDTRFGVDGVVELPGEPGTGQHTNLVLTNGTLTVGPLGTSVLRFTLEGSPDATFGDDGVMSWPSEGARDARFGVLAIHDERHFVVVQSSVGSEAAISVLALLPDGTPDPSFSATGWVTHSLGVLSHDPLFRYPLGALASDGFLYVISERPGNSGSLMIRIRI